MKIGDVVNFYGIKTRYCGGDKYKIIADEEAELVNKFVPHYLKTFKSFNNIFIMKSKSNIFYLQRSLI